MASVTNAFVRVEDAPKLAAPANSFGLYATIRDRFFYSPLSTVATLLLALMIFLIVWSIADWALFRAIWSGENREVCAANGAGACWPFAGAKLLQWVYGFYPIAERWRVNIVYLMGAVSLAGLLIPSIPYKNWNAGFFFIVYPVITFVLLLGGMFGLTYVETAQWGGLLVTLVISVIGIVASMPVGILLALGRRSKMPVIRIICTLFIEIVRGVPLIAVLFMASVMFPLFMPPGVNFDKLLRALIAVALFSSAYMAEVVRGGLQAIPKGQYEAAQALGLPYWKLMGLIVMPQALRIVIPSIVNSFISLFKDTSLVSVIGIFDLLNMVQAGFNDATWASPQTGNTGYFVLALIYWAFCFAMSRYSAFVERRLNTGHSK
jgi:general L-amino acid transport system permease protein